MFASSEFERRFASFPPNYLENFNYVWKWKVKVESNSENYILDKEHRREAYARLSNILPKWQTYRNGNNVNSLKTLRDSLDCIWQEYDLLRKYTLLDFDDIALEPLKKIWHELGRVKESEGKKNPAGCYSAVAVSKPLLLIWGQTPAFDSFVRKNMSLSFDLPKYSCNWTFEQWIRIMGKLSKALRENEKTVKFLKEKSSQLYGQKAVVPYGRFIDIYYWEGSD